MSSAVIPSSSSAPLHTKDTTEVVRLGGGAAVGVWAGAAAGGGGGFPLGMKDCCNQSGIAMEIPGAAGGGGTKWSGAGGGRYNSARQGSRSRTRTDPPSTSRSMGGPSSSSAPPPPSSRRSKTLISPKSTPGAASSSAAENLMIPPCRKDEWRGIEKRAAFLLKEFTPDSTTTKSSTATVLGGRGAWMRMARPRPSFRASSRSLPGTTPAPVLYRVWYPTLPFRDLGLPSANSVRFLSTSSVSSHFIAISIGIRSSSMPLSRMRRLCGTTMPAPLSPPCWASPCMKCSAYLHCPGDSTAASCPAGLSPRPGPFPSP
eukprot:Hpha_TRINITY_DN8031_c0_g2::TRINITY_DN8031_c0_g2_i1::g.140203::m.140203